MSNIESEEEKKVARLKSLIREGLDDLKAGNIHPGQTIFAELRDSLNNEPPAKN